MKIARFSGLAAVAAAVLLISGSSAHAVFVPLPTTLDQLTGANGANTTGVGSLTFSGFTYVGTGTAPTAANIALSAIDGSGFQFSGAFGAASPNSGDSQISMTAASALGITSVTLGGNPAVQGSGIASITETFYASSSSTVALGQILVTPTTPGLSATFTFASALSSVFIKKDILYSATAAGSTAQISFVTQTFTTGVPEPASVVMMGLGLVGAIGVVRLRRNPVVA